jgi:hypothetical protein
VERLARNREASGDAGFRKRNFGFKREGRTFLSSCDELKIGVKVWQ